MLILKVGAIKNTLFRLQSCVTFFFSDKFPLRRVIGSCLAWILRGNCHFSPLAYHVTHHHVILLVQTQDAWGRVSESEGQSESVGDQRRKAWALITRRPALAERLQKLCFVFVLLPCGGLLLHGLLLHVSATYNAVRVSYPSQLRHVGPYMSHAYMKYSPLWKTLERG